MPVPLQQGIDQALAQLALPAGEVRELNLDGKVKSTVVEVSKISRCQSDHRQFSTCSLIRSHAVSAAGLPGLYIFTVSLPILLSVTETFSELFP